MQLDILETDKAVTLQQAQEIIRQVIPQEAHQYIPKRGEKQETSLGEMFDILQTSLLNAFQNKFQAAANDLDLVHNRQKAIESLMGAVRNDLIHSVIGVRDDLVKYLEFIKHADEISTDVEPMEIDSVGRIPNYLA